MKPGYWGITGLGVGFAMLWLAWPDSPPAPLKLTESQKRAIAQKVHTEILFGQLIYKQPELVPPAVSFAVIDPRNAAESLCEFQLVSTGSPAWSMNVNEQMAAENYHQFLTVTLPHEVGHLLRCQWDPAWQAHDARWETIVRDMGATPVPRHDYRVEAE